MERLMQTGRLFGLILVIWSCCGANAVMAQNEEDYWPDRIVEEKGWIPMRKAITRPADVQNLYQKGGVLPHDSILSQFPHIEGLILQDVPMADLSVLQHFPNLKVFECSGNRLKSISGIDSVPGLQDVSITNNFVREVGPLRKLTGLKTLNLYANELEDVNPLMDLVELTHLDLSKNNLTHIDSLYWMTDLEFLSLYRCANLRNVDPIRNFRQLKSLNLSGLELPDFSVTLLDSLPQLEDLRVQGIIKNNDEITLIGKHTTLRSLTMGRNDGVSNIYGLKTLTNLEYLDIHSNNVSDISVVYHFPKLIKIVMYRNKINDIEPLTDCLELQSVFMFENPVEDYTPLYMLKGLRYLHVTRAHFDSDSAGKLRENLPLAKVSFI